MDKKHGQKSKSTNTTKTDANETTLEGIKLGIQIHAAWERFQEQIDFSSFDSGQIKIFHTIFSAGYLNGIGDKAIHTAILKENLTWPPEGTWKN